MTSASLRTHNRVNAGSGSGWPSSQSRSRAVTAVAGIEVATVWTSMPHRTVAATAAT
ncbi:MAG: hypothetical protein QM619_11675 [Micropruina sp.]